MLDPTQGGITIKNDISYIGAQKFVRSSCGGTGQDVTQRYDVGFEYGNGVFPPTVFK